MPHSNCTTELTHHFLPRTALVKDAGFSCNSKIKRNCKSKSRALLSNGLSDAHRLSNIDRLDVDKTRQER